jgi:hypothetical protein
VSTPTRPGPRTARGNAAAGAAGRVGRLRKHRGPDHPETVAAEREQATAQIENYVAKIVEAFPPLTDEQISRITALLRTAPDGGGDFGKG